MRLYKIRVEELSYFLLNKYAVHDFWLYPPPTPPPHSTGLRARYANGDLGFSLKLFQIAAEAKTATRSGDLTLPVRFHYASTTPLLRCCYDPTTTMKIWLRLVYADGDVAATLLRPWRWSYAFVALLYPFYIESEIPIHFDYDQGASTALLPFPLRFVSFWPKFWIVAESPSSGMGVLPVMLQVQPVWLVHWGVSYLVLYTLKFRLAQFLTVKLLILPSLSNLTYNLVLKRTVSLWKFFWVPTTYVLVEK